MSGAYRRPLTAQESKKVQAAARKFSSTPPWTAESEETNSKFRELIAELFMDGVSMSSLGEAAGWTVGRVNQQILKARAQGLLDGDRQIPEAPPRRRPEPATRELAEEEADELVELLERVPRKNHKNNQKTGKQINWDTPGGRKLLRRIQDLQKDRVSIAKCAAVLGLSRALLSARIAMLDVQPAQANSRKPRRLPDRVWNDLVERSAELPVSRRAERNTDGKRIRPLTWIYTRRWKNQLGRELLGEARSLVEGGYDFDEVAAALELEPRQLKRLLSINTLALA